MKSLYRVSDGWIFNADIDINKLTSHENSLIGDNTWGIIETESLTTTEVKHYKIVDGEMVLLPEEQWPDYIQLEEEIV